jgi:hypothetical protein
MISIDKALISSQIGEVCFCCDLAACKGACCVDGDAGAPLAEEEISILEDYIDAIKPFMNTEGIEVVNKNGVFEYDHEGNFVTPLVNHRECAFVIYEDEIAVCAVEKAFNAGVQPFRKPLSCHLYPIRITNYEDFDAINYHEWHICRGALAKGKELGLPLHEFVKEALVRKYGSGWYADFSRRFQQ